MGGAAWTLVFASAVYALVVVGWLIPWHGAASLELFAPLLVVSMHVCLLAWLGAFFRALRSSPGSGPLFGPSSALETTVGGANWAVVGRFHFFGLVLAWTVSVGSVMRLCELAGMIHLGSTAPGAELSLSSAACLVTAELASALVLPMCFLSLSSLLRWRAAHDSSLRLTPLRALLLLFLVP